jgi:GT2 family glycosyltransferase
VSFAVIIPTYNRAGFIGETLASVLAQTTPPDEIIVVDDGSTDDTEALIRRDFAAVIYHRTENRGAPHARHMGAGLSTASHLAFIDSDDLWLPDHLAQLCAIFAADPDIGFAFSNFQEMTDRAIASHSKFDLLPPDFWPLPTSPLSDHLLRCAAPLSAAILRFQPIFPSAMAVTRQHYHRIGGFKAELGMLPSEDLEFTLRAVAQGPIGVVTTPNVVIRKHSGNHSAGLANMLIGEIIVLDIALRTHAASPDLAQAIAASQIARCFAAMDALYRVGCVDLLPALARAVGWGNLSGNTRMKALLSLLPRSWAKPVAQRIAGMGEAHIATQISANLGAQLATALTNLRDRRVSPAQ